MRRDERDTHRGSKTHTEINETDKIVWSVVVCPAAKINGLLSFLCVCKRAHDVTAIPFKHRTIFGSFFPPSVASYTCVPVHIDFQYVYIFHYMDTATLIHWFLFFHSN